MKSLLWSSSDSGLYERALRLYESRPDLRAAFPDPEGEPFWLWANNHGLRESDELRALLPPVPPGRLMVTVSGSDELSAYLNVGALSFTAIQDILRAQGRDPYAYRDILDFGCGCGRTLRFFQPYAAHARLQGTDVDRDAIAWCQSQLEFARFSANGPRPPTEFAATQFDLIYSISVFTHLSEENHLSWVQEMRRLCKPDGALVVSIHGPHAWRRVDADAGFRDVLNIAHADWQSSQARWREAEFAFMPHKGLSDYLDPAVFGITFLTVDYIKRMWKDFEVVAYKEAAISDWQDLVLLRPV